MTPELHPLCTLFPRMGEAEFKSLCADIAANGQKDPIVLYEGMVLDGGNRLRACLQAGVEPQFKVFDGANLVSYVLSANLHRRHLSPGQQAAIVASTQNWAKANTQGQNKVTGNVAGDTVADRARQSGAGERTQRMADKVVKADPELGRQVARGEISLPKALDQVAPKPAAAPARPPAPTTVAAPAVEAVEVEGAEDDFDPLHELELLNREITKLRALVAAEDHIAEAARWQSAYDVAQRRSDEHLVTIASRDKQITFLARQLARCGKAVGEADTDKIAPAVERLARAGKEKN